ncbi:phosphate signaling complex protein PhoU [Fredinandcohnia sp. QZ13]|uniref:phosphate signaling complex protein PhoU n=1 Tax=Fredinandcohnia sp. QZ13 TaxID=3073144 RepID=UPI0028536BE6|nr:phosphate signaling complex protein PhoU [Fredinandcohnia sp. QZ13]MDR4888943.1 phosphate signaling complex protein PhoU [Fredinandcohnia sp. QZ13]
MAIRTTLDKDLDRLKDLLIEMVNLSKTAVEKSVQSLAHQNIEMADQIIEEDQKINDLEEKINNLIIQLIAQQQPVASDLRTIIAGLKISNDIERIGDLAVNISKSVIHIGAGPHIKPIVDIPRMADMALDMLNNVIKAYIEKDIELAITTAKADDEIDALYGKIIKELLELVPSKPDSFNQISQLSFVARNLERIADHTTNMSEHIIFMVKGKNVDLNA